MFLIILIIIAVLLGVLVYVFHECFYSPICRNIDPNTILEGSQYQAVEDHIKNCTRIMDQTPFEAVTITSYDGLKLYGRYYHLQDGAPIQIQFHGYRSHALRDCSGGFMLARKMGFNVLSVDQRAHANSEGTVITFGIKERYDCLKWANYAYSRFGEASPIILSGLSMGAATVLMASNLNLPKTVACIMADCPYESPEKIIGKVCSDRRLPAKLAMPFIKISAHLFGKFSLNESSAIASVKNTNIPILIIHGADDHFVPVEMSINICNACNGSCQMHIFPDAGHGLSYMVDPIQYEFVVTKFLWQLDALQPHLAKSDYVQKVLNGEEPLV